MQMVSEIRPGVPALPPTRTLKRTVFLGAWLVALVVALSIPIVAIERGILTVGGTYTSQSRLGHPLIAIGSRVELPKGSRELVLDLFGSVSVNRTASDDIATLGAPIYLHPGATVKRDIVAVGGNVYRAPRVRVTGQIGGDMVAWNGVGSPGGANVLAGIWNYSGLSLAAGLALLLVCVCISIAFPWPTVLVATYLYREVVRSILAGLMGAALFIFLVVPLGLSLFGLPFALLLAVTAAGAWLLGLTASAVMIGRHVALLRHHDAGLLWAVVSGMFLLAIAGSIPFLGALIMLLAGTTGAGALGLTMVARARPNHPLRPLGRHETFPEGDAYMKGRGASMSVEGAYSEGLS
jgi:hypothetical protein